MKGARLILGIALMAAGSLGAYWVCAQEGPLWPAPPVLPPDVPRPRPLDGPIKGPPSAAPKEILPVGGVVPKPLFPEAPKKDASAPPPLPSLLPELSVPMPDLGPLPKPLEPTKALIKDPPLPDVINPVQMKDILPPPLPLPAQKKDPGPPPLPLPETKKDLGPPPLPMPEEKKNSLQFIFPDLKKDPFTPPPLAMPETKKDGFGPLPFALPEMKKDRFTPPPLPEVKKNLAPFVIPEAKKEPLPPPLLIPDVKKEVIAPKADARIKSFLPLRPTQVDPPLLDSPKQRPLPVPAPIAPTLTPQGKGTLNVQTPSVIVEKRGAARIRAGEIAAYQFIVRNLGPVPAQVVRIEEELGVNVKVLNAEPAPAIEGNRAVWTLPTLNVNQEQVLRLALRATNDVEVAHRVSVTVSASSQSAVALRPRQIAEALDVRLIGPGQTALGKTATFEIRVTNNTGRPIDGMILHGLLPEGLYFPGEGRDIQGAVDGVLMPGEVKTLKMPASTVKPGRHTVHVKVATRSGVEATDAASIDIVGEGLHLQHAPSTQLFLGRDGDMRIDLTNHSNRTMRNVVVADRLPEGVDFVAASDRGLFQSNSRTVHWLIDQLPAGKTQTLYVRVHGKKPGQHANFVLAKADGVAEVQAPGVINLEGLADLTMRVVGSDNVLEVGRETVYEIQLQNPGSVSASNVRLQVQFPPGLTPRRAEASSRHIIDRHTVTFEPIDAIGPQGQAIFRVTALAQGVGDQRVRFAVVSDQVRTPIQREISTMVYRD